MVRLLQSKGPDFGYCAKPAKTILLVQGFITRVIYPLGIKFTYLGSKFNDAVVHFYTVLVIKKNKG